MSLNIFQIWDSVGHKTPFAVRRDNWTEEYYTIVEKIDCEKLPYGKAFGYPTFNGKYSTHYEYDGKWKREKIIPCCGCYQWTLVENADLTSYKDGLKATKKTVKSAYTLSSRFYFGKFEGSTVEEIFRDNPSYIEWSVNNIDKFFLAPKTLDYLDKLKPDFKFKDMTRQMNEQKVGKRQKA